MQLIDDIYSGKISPEHLDFNLFTTYKNNLLNGAGKGLNQSFDEVDYNTPDYALLTKMKRNLYTFSGAKTRAQLQEINALLYAKDGKLLPKTVFKDRASQFYRDLGITNKKYFDWLDIEHATCIAQGTKARQWQGFMDNIDVIPNLKYITVGDSHVRPAHEKLYGLVAPKTDKIWDKIYPIKDWGCRCDVIETDEQVTNKVDFEYDGPFEGNVGRDGIVISKKHPYFPEAKKAMEKLQQNVDAFSLAEHIDINRKIYNQYNIEAGYHKVHFDDETGGYLVQHDRAAEMLPNEIDVVNILIKNGEGIVIPAKPTSGYTKAFDIKINEVPFEIKTVTGDVKRRTEERVKEAMQQSGNVVLQFKEKVSLTELKRGLGNVKNQMRLNSIIVIVKDKLAVITKKEIIAGDYSAIEALK